jgi:FixJ family two-component response regulator
VTGLARATNTSEEVPVVFIVDDDASVREALAGLLGSVGIVVKQFASAIELLGHAECLKLNHSGRPNCMILDIRMPGIGGLELQERLVTSSVHLPIIFVSGHGDITMTVQAMKAGAHDFLPKPFRDQDMLDAVRSALTYDRKHRELERFDSELHDRYASLTPREQAVLRLVTQGMMNKQIAFELSLSEITIKVHRGQLMRKMNAKSLAELVKMDGRIHDFVQKRTVSALLR